MRPPDPEALAGAVDYLPLVRRIARRLGRRLPAHVSTDDLVSAGVLGLLHAMQRFDPERADSFEAFAECRIRGAILDELRRADLMARDARSETKRLEAQLSELASRLGRPPEEEEVARALDMSVGDLRSKLARLVPVRVCSFEDVVTSADAQAGPFEVTARAQARSRLADALARLNPRQQQVLHLYYQEELNLREIGSVLQVTESRVCQILAAATLQLRAYLSRRKGADHG